MVRESCTQPSGFVIVISLEKRCLHIDRITGAIAQAACNHTALQPVRMKRRLLVDSDACHFFQPVVLCHAA